MRDARPDPLHPRLYKPAIWASCFEIYATATGILLADVQRTMSDKILLVTTVGWPSAARYAANFAATGCHVDAFAPDYAPPAASRYVSRHHRYRALRPLASLQRAIDASRPDLIVACDDRAVAQLLCLYHRADQTTAALIARSLGPPENYETVMSRNESLRAIAALGVRVPETYGVANLDELEDCLTQTGFPAAIKADGTWGGNGVAIVETRQAARAAFRRLGRRPSPLRSLARAIRRKDLHHLTDILTAQPPAVSVQRFISGTSAASAFSAWQGEITGAIYYDVLVADRTIGPPNVIHRLDCPQMAHASRIVAERFGLSGLHGLDFIRDTNGDVHLIEINPRGTQGGTLPFGPGRDISADLASRAFSRPWQGRTAIANDVVVLFPREWRRDRDSVWLKTGYHDVPWDDPAVLYAALGAPAKSSSELRPRKPFISSRGSRTVPSC